jgi:hypothetical protein
MHTPQDFVGPIATTTAITLAPVAWFIDVLNWLDLLLRVAVGLTSLIAGVYAIAHYRAIRAAEKRREEIAAKVIPEVAPMVAKIVPAVVAAAEAAHGKT